MLFNFTSWKKLDMTPENEDCHLIPGLAPAGRTKKDTVLLASIFYITIYNCFPPNPKATHAQFTHLLLHQQIQLLSIVCQALF